MASRRHPADHRDRDRRWFLRDRGASGSRSECRSFVDRDRERGTSSKQRRRGSPGGSSAGRVDGYRREASRDRSEQEFLEHVYAQFPPQLILDGERAVRAVFEVLWKKIAEGEILKIVHLLPAELRDLWPWVAKES